MKCHTLKRQYYDTPEIRDWAASKAECDPQRVQVSAVVFNWRGAIAQPSALDLLRLGLTRGDLRLLSVVVLEKGFAAYMFSRRSTMGKLQTKHDASSL